MLTLPLDHFDFLAFSHLKVFISIFQLWETFIILKKQERNCFICFSSKRRLLPACFYSHRTVRELCWWALAVGSVNPIPQWEAQIKWVQFIDNQSSFPLPHTHCISSVSSMSTHVHLFNKTYKNKNQETFSVTTSLSLQRQAPEYFSLWPHIYSCSIAICLIHFYSNALAKAAHKNLTTLLLNSRDPLHFSSCWSFVKTRTLHSLKLSPLLTSMTLLFPGFHNITSLALLSWSPLGTLLQLIS